MRYHHRFVLLQKTYFLQRRLFHLGFSVSLKNTFRRYAQYFFLYFEYHYSLKWTSKHYTFHKLSLIIGICNLMTFYFDFNYIFSLAANSASWAIHRFIFSAVFSGGDARAPPEFGSSQKGTVFTKPKIAKNG